MLYDEFGFSAAVGVGFFGNEDTNKGIVQISTSVSGTMDTVAQMRQKVRSHLIQTVQTLCSVLFISQQMQ